MRKLCAIAAVAMLCLSTWPLHAYSVLTHEQIIDLAWQERIEPMLQKRFAQCTPDDLKRAHAFAYGGSLVQDMGYYPFGNKFFSDLVHYVRTRHRVSQVAREVWQ